MGATRANSAIVHAGFDAKEGSLKEILEQATIAYSTDGEVQQMRSAAAAARR